MNCRYRRRRFSKVFGLASQLSHNDRVKTNKYIRSLIDQLRENERASQTLAGILLRIPRRDDHTKREQELADREADLLAHLNEKLPRSIKLYIRDYPKLCTEEAPPEDDSIPDRRDCIRRQRLESRAPPHKEMPGLVCAARGLSAALAFPEPRLRYGKTRIVAIQKISRTPSRHARRAS